MKHLFLLLLAAVALTQSASGQYHYPASRIVEVSDEYFGTTIPDPYRWLEDVKSPEVTDWLKAQADYTNSVLNTIPNQDKLIREFETYDAMRTISYFPVAKANGKYFYRKRLPGEQVSKLYYRQGEDRKSVV